MLLYRHPRELNYEHPGINVPFLKVFRQAFVCKKGMESSGFLSILSRDDQDTKG
jgi:hypothetical protein